MTGSPLMSRNHEMVSSPIAASWSMPAMISSIDAPAGMCPPGIDEMLFLADRGDVATSLEAHVRKVNSQHQRFRSKTGGAAHEPFGDPVLAHHVDLVPPRAP